MINFILELCKFIMSNNKLAENHNFSHMDQKYRLETIITDIFWIFKNGCQ
jgi:hypothetical protein